MTAATFLDRVESTALVRQLDDPAAWPRAAAALVAELGFRLIEPDPSRARGDSLEGHLLVALRDRPTLQHFDPESMSFYAPTEAGAQLTTIQRLGPGATARQAVSWGHVHVADRVPVENRFLTFGGMLHVVSLDDSLTVAHLRSPVPIVRWGGHSQGTDGLAEAIGAFFGRLIVPVDFVPGAAARIDALSPEVIFTAFVVDAVRRLDAAARSDAEPSALDRWLRAASTRLRPATAWRTAADSLLAEFAV